MNISPGHTGHPNLPEGSSRPSWGQTLGVLAFVLVVGAVGYAFTGRPDALKDVPVTEQAGHDGVSQEQIAAMVEGLATRLKQQPDDAKGWAMLGRSYMFMGRHEDAKKALQELVRLQPNDPNALADLADAAAMVQGRTLQGEPMQWVQRALKIDPQHVKALALAGTEAFARQDYVQAARVIGVSPARIMLKHVLPNVMGPVLVLATIQVGQAILAEATLSFLGVGVPPTSPSLGTLIRVGNDFLFSGEWWITIFPGVMLVLIALSVNLLGDWLRDAVNPRLQ